MSSETSTAPKIADTPTDDVAWQRVKERYRVGQLVRGRVDDVQTYGVLFDIGIRFPAFMDIIDVGEASFNIGDEASMKIVQFADWNKQVRVASPDNRQVEEENLQPR